MILVYLLRMILFLIPHRILEGLAYIFAWLLFYIFKFKSNIVLQNIDLVYQDKITQKKKNIIAIQSYKNFLLTIMEFLVGQRIFQNISVKLDLSQVEGNIPQKGFFAITIHQGNWEVMAAQGSKLVGKQVSILSRVIGSPSIDRWVKKHRAKLGYSVVNRSGHKAPLEMVKFVEQGHVIGFMVDQRRDKDIAVPFFGIDAYTNVSLIRIARLSKEVPIYPIAIQRKSLCKFVIKIYPAVEMVFTNDQEKDIFNNAVKMNKAVEAMILDNPYEYYWFHKRWKGFYHYHES